MAVFDWKAIDHPIKSLIWKRCRDNVIALWAHTHEYANHYWITSTPLVRQVRFALLWKPKMKIALNL